MKRLTGLLLIVNSFLIGSLIIYRWLSTSSVVLGSQTDLTPATIISLTNLNRIKNGLSPVSPNPLLTLAAQNKAADMLRYGYFSHTTVTNKPPWYFLNQVAYPYEFAGENLARDFTSAETVMNAWLNSPSHRDNLLNPRYTEIGLAVTTGTYPDGRPTTLVVQFLGRPTTQDQKTVPAGTFSEAAILTPNPLAFWQPWLFLAILSLALALILFIIRSKRWKNMRFRPQADWWSH